MAGRFDVGAVIARAGSAWLRSLPVALVVLFAGAAPLVLWAAGASEFVQASAAAGLGNVVYMSAMQAQIVDDFWPSFPAVHGLVSVAACYVVTGVLVSFHHARRVPGPMTILRLGSLGFYFGLGLTVCNLLLGDVVPRGNSGLLILGPVLFVESWAACRLWLVIPALVVEKRSVPHAMFRSFVLTRGAAVRILALVVMLAAVPIGGLFVMEMTRFRDTVFVLWMLWLAGALVTSVQAALVMESYRALKVAPPVSVAGVFD